MGLAFREVVSVATVSALRTVSGLPSGMLLSCGASLSWMEVATLFQGCKSESRTCRRSRGR
jgi:hypothetical protein